MYLFLIFLIIIVTIWTMYYILVNNPLWKQKTLIEYDILHNLFGRPTSINFSQNGYATWTNPKPYSFIMISDKPMKNCCGTFSHTILAVLDYELFNIYELLPILSIKNIAYTKRGQVIIDCENVKDMIKNTKFIQYIVSNLPEIKAKYSANELLAYYDSIEVESNIKELEQLSKNMKTRSCEGRDIDCTYPLAHSSVNSYMTPIQAGGTPPSIPNLGKFNYKKNVGIYKLGVPFGYLTEGKDPKRPSYTIPVNPDLKN